MTLIIANNLGFSYSGLQALDQVSLTLAKGEGLAVLGANGAGKSTLLRLLAKQAEPQSGSIDFGKAKVSWVPQTLMFFEALTVQENLISFSKLAHGSVPIETLFDQIKLKHKRHDRAGHLSGGQQRLLNLGLALAASPQVLVLDEPSAGVDLETRAHIHQVLTELKAKGMALVFTTHDMTEAQRLADRLILLDQGQKICDQSLQDLLNGALKDHVELTLNGGKPALMPRAEAMEILNNSKPDELSLKKPSMEAVIKHLGQQTSVRAYMNSKV